jgi:hypothetical protein
MEIQENNPNHAITVRPAATIVGQLSKEPLMIWLIANPDFFPSRISGISASIKPSKGNKTEKTTTAVVVVPS